MSAADLQLRAQSNRRLAWQLSLVVLFFAGFGFALVPLYDVICRVTGINGRTNAIAAVPARNTQVDTSRWVTVQFLSHTMPGVGLTLRPQAFSMRVHPGEVVHINYIAHNPTDRGFAGQAIPSVTPAVASTHFQKIDCFCFKQQNFAPGEERTMPVVFVVSPDLDEDLRTLTLSYTFFEAVAARS